MFKFGLRDLLWLIAVVGLFLALYSERSRSGRLNHKLSTMRNFARNRGYDIVTVGRPGPWSVVQLPSKFETPVDEN